EECSELKAQLLALGLARRHALRVLLGRRPIGVLVVVPEPPTGDDAPLVEPSAETPSRLVQRGANSPPMKAGVHVDVRPVQRVRLRVVVREVAAIGDPRPRMMAERVRPEVNEEGRNGSHDLPVDLRHQLPLREYALVADEVTLT